MRSLNRIQIIGVVVKDPEYKTPEDKSSVVNFTVLTTRTWTTESGEQRSDMEYHRVTAWKKLADIVKDNVFKDTNVYVDGRVSTRKRISAEGTEMQYPEIIANEIIVLDKS